MIGPGVKANIETSISDKPCENDLSVSATALEIKNDLTETDHRLKVKS